MNTEYIIIYIYIKYNIYLSESYSIPPGEYYRKIENQYNRRLQPLAVEYVI